MRKGSMGGRRIDPWGTGIVLSSRRKYYVLAEWYAFIDICAGI